MSDTTAAKPFAVELHQLFPNGDAAGRTLSVPLPPGRIVRGDEGDSDLAALWLSDEPAPDGLWARLRAEHPRSGLWPLLLRPLANDEPTRPWDDGELWPDDMSAPDEHDPETLLAQWWRDYTTPEQDELSPAERAAITAPYGQRWPGLAPAAVRDDPDRVAETLAVELPSFRATWRLGLVAAERGAEYLPDPLGRHEQHPVVVAEHDVGPAHQVRTEPGDGQRLGLTLVDPQRPGRVAAVAVHRPASGTKIL